MQSLKIFLTHSQEAAAAISRGFTVGMDEHGNKIKRVTYGFVDGNKNIPTIYHDREYFYCEIESERNDVSLGNNYELIFC